MHPPPPSFGPNRGIFSRTSKAHTRPLRSQSFKSIEALMEMPHRSAKPARQRPLGQQCVIVGLGAINHVGHHREVTGWLPLPSLSEGVIATPIRNRLLRLPRRERAIIKRE